jgi:hypothetical protein
VYVSDDTGADDDVPILVVTVTAICPAAPAGASTLQVDEVHPMIVAGADPKFTAVAPDRPEPAMVTGSPPAVDPVDGDRDEMAGGGVVVPTTTLPESSPATQKDDEGHETDIRVFSSVDTMDHVPAPPVGSADVQMAPCSFPGSDWRPTMAQNACEGQETFPNGPPRVAGFVEDVHEPQPPVGSIVVATAPVIPGPGWRCVSPAAAHRLFDEQEMPNRPTPPDAETTHVPAPPVGSVEVTTSPRK